MQYRLNDRYAMTAFRPNWPMISVILANTAGWALVAVVGRAVIG